MTDRQKSEVLSILKRRSSVAAHSLCGQLSISLDEARVCLLEAVNTLGRDLFRLIYCLQKSDERAFALVASASSMDVESEDMVLFAVQYKEVSRETVQSAEKVERFACMENALAAGTLVANYNAGIQPLQNTVRDLLPHRKRKTPADIPPTRVTSEAVKNETVKTEVVKTETVKTEAMKTETVKTAPMKGKPSVLKSQTKLKMTAKEQTASPQRSAPSSPQEEPAKPVKEASQPHVTFSDDSAPVEKSVKRRSTPHPNKHSKRSDDSLAEILKSSLYTVEEDDMEATPNPTLKRKLEETTEPLAKKTSARTESTPAETAATLVLTEGFKRVKVTKTKTFMEKGYLVSKDVVEEEVIKVQTMPLKPVNAASVAHKKGKQTSIGAFLDKKR